MIAETLDHQKETYWEALVNKDARYDGSFLYGVRSTGIYCRPSCPSRRPNRDQVLFFQNHHNAEQAGYRACLRCHPQTGAFHDKKIRAIGRICSYIDANLEHSLTLQSLSTHSGMSPFHLQRTFKQVMGISPRQYIEGRRLACLKRELKKGHDVTRSLYEVGYSSSSRLYERSTDQMGMTPGTYKRGGAKTKIDYTILDCPVGKLLIAATEKGLCAVTIGDSQERLEGALRDEYPKAELHHSPATFIEWRSLLQKYFDGEKRELDLPIDVQATVFQQKVWAELKKIPYGQTRTYAQIAQAIGNPKAAQAVGRACASNKVAIVLPCHRVVREDGDLGGYRWGLERKKKLLDQEKR